MRQMRTILGWVVASAAGATACGADAPERGIVYADGTKTEGERVRTDDGCNDFEDWSYTLDPSISCDAARALVATDCASKVCGDNSAWCSATDASGQAYAFAGGEGTVQPCASGGQRPTMVKCKKTVDSRGCAVEGRRPEGLHPVDSDSFASAASYFANAAHLEAAAVLAFERLAVELRAHGAPPALLGRLRRAAREERRHVEIASALATRFGAEPLGATAEPFVPRPLVDIARENVIEGVVRETFGAAVALFRGEHAGDACVRESLAEIAEDECRHAQLSWDLHAWLWELLGEDERLDVEAARVRAIGELREALWKEPAEELVVVAGVPRSAEALALWTGLFDHAWTAAAA